METYINLKAESFLPGQLKYLRIAPNFLSKASMKVPHVAISTASLP